MAVNGQDGDLSGKYHVIKKIPELMELPTATFVGKGTANGEPFRHPPEC
jgi:hypothetical protein